MDAAKRKRIGIMGGTFDPIHIGHLILAECAYEQFSLDAVLFLPSGNPPHKVHRPDGASDRERLDMVRLAVRDNPHFILDEEEMRRSGFTYTYETLRLMKQSQPQTQFYFIIGGDSLMAFDSWMHPESISRDCILLAAVRDGLPSAVMEEKARELKQRFDADVRFLHSPNLEISSTQLRRWYREGRSVRYYVPDEVLSYMKEHRVYREN